MRTFSFVHVMACLALGLGVVVGGVAVGQTVRPPPQAEWDKVTADVTGTDSVLQDDAAVKIRKWIDGGWVSRDLWVKWLPGLVKTGKHSKVAELSLEGIFGRPNMDGIVPLMEFRVRALLAMNKGDEALAAAKGYYNVIEMKGTARGVDLVGVCLAKARPEDTEIVRKFRAEQAAASTGTPPATGEGILKGVKVDAKLYEKGLEVWGGKTRFVDRVGDGNLLLVADKGVEAEKLFRELFALAVSQDELTMATEGIARALRAQDGNVLRANAWLASLQAKEALSGATTATRPAKTILP